VAVKLKAQQSQLYTQYMYNKMVYNAAYAGSLEAPSFNLLYRQQWIGLEGAPEAQILGFHTPLKNENIALGFNIERQVIGIEQNLTLNGIYVYRFKVSKEGKLGLGVNVSGRYFEQDFTDDRLQATQGTELDNAISNGIQSKLVANIGFGAYYHEEKLYFGFSIPRIAKSDIDFDEVDPRTGREARHFNIMGGYSFELSDAVSLTSQALVRLTENAPFDLDINAMFGFYDNFFAGLTYRHYRGSLSTLAESIDVLAGVQITPRLYTGLAYDFTLTKIGRYSNGSVEAMIRYNIIEVAEKDTYVNPRYF
jgi:type IX secretion system PorP/SprF family membrane protein